VAADPGGGFIFADQGAGLVRRVDGAGTITTIAGTTSAGPSGGGIGGPATEAHLADPHAVTTAADGRVLIDDDGRILVIDSDGTLRLMTTLADPAATDQIAAQADGGVLVLHRDTITRIAPDGHHGRFARLAFPAVGLVALPDGGALTIDTRARRILKISPDAGSSVIVNERAFRDFAGREPTEYYGDVDPQASFVGLAQGAEGLFVATDSSVLLVPQTPITRAGIRIVGSRVTADSAALRVWTTQPGTISLTLHRIGSDSPALARSETAAAPGAHWLRQALGSRRHGLYRVQAELATPSGNAADSVSLAFGPTLSATLVEGVMSRYDGRGGWPFTCRHVISRRVDCWTGFGGGRSCDTMLSITAASDGLLHRRDYRCNDGRPRFRRHPHFTGRASVVLPR
jgi:hypothetical protein